MRSNTPKAALVLLNDPTFVEAARNLAERVMTEVDEEQERLALLWRIAVSRRPDFEEQKLLKDLLERRRREYKNKPNLAEELLAIGISSTDTTLDLIERAAWTATARVVLNLREAIGRY